MRMLLFTVIVPAMILTAYLKWPQPDPAPVDVAPSAMEIYQAREQAARERRIAAAETRARRRLQKEAAAAAWEQSRETDWEQVARSAQRPRAARPQTRMGARDWASRITGELDSPMEPIQAQMAESGIAPALSRQGDLRIFTYRFADGSELELAAVPAGGRTGLLLYYVDIRD